MLVGDEVCTGKSDVVGEARSVGVDVVAGGEHVGVEVGAALLKSFH